MEDQREYVRNLPDSIKESLNWYTDVNYITFNEIIRSGKVIPRNERVHYENITTAFDQSPPLKHSVIVYKGIVGEKVFSDKAFVSTTTSYDVTKYFSLEECCVLEITVSAGSLILPISEISNAPDEHEVLLDRGGTMTVTGTDIRDNKKIIYVTYTPQFSAVITEEKNIDSIVEDFDDNLIIERIIEFFKDDDKDFLDEETIISLYKRLTKRKIRDKDLEKIKNRLGI